MRFYPSLQGGRITLASGFTLAGGEKIARLYKQNSTGRVAFRKLILPGVFTREKVNPPAKVTLARR